jgi:hypothetical protein
MLKHRLIQPLLLRVCAAATFLISVSIVQAAEECRLKPGSTAPSGSRWVYRINRTDHRHCWYLSSKAGAGITHSRLAHRYRHLAGDPETVQQDQQDDRELQIASAPTDKTDVVVAAQPQAVLQAATPSVEQSSGDLVPRSVPTIFYRLPPASAQTVTEPTIRALSVQTGTPAAASKSNLGLLAGAAVAGLFFAGGVFHFTRRVHRRVRMHVVTDGHGVTEPVGVRPLVDAMPLPMTTDFVEDVEQRLRNLKRERLRIREDLALSVETRDDTAVFLPHAATWLSRPKAKPRTPASYELVDA